MRHAAVLGLGLAALLTGELSANGAPQRIVSLSLCTDQLLLRLAPKERIASVTWLAKDENHSAAAPLAENVPENRGLAEEIIALRPDLVLASTYTARPAVEFLKRSAVETLDLPVPETLSQLRSQIHQIADALGDPESGRALIAQMDEQFAALPPLPDKRPKAILLGPNGFATSYSPLLNEVFERAGLRNMAADLGAAGLAAIPIESVLKAGVDVLVIEPGEAGPALAQELLRHPALTVLRERATIVHLPSRLWTCAGPQLAEAARILAAARLRHEAK